MLIYRWVLKAALVAAITIYFTPAALPQEVQTQQVPAQRVVAQGGRAQELKWNIIVTDRTSFDDMRLDSLVADTLYTSNKFRNVKSIGCSEIAKIEYQPNHLAWAMAGVGAIVLGATVAILVSNDAASTPASTGIHSGNAKGDIESSILPLSFVGGFLGGLFGLVIGTVIDGVTMDSYDLTKMTTAPKALLLTDLLVSGTSTRR